MSFSFRSIAGQMLFPIGLGAMPLSIEDGPSEETALRVIHAAFEAGIALVDTADVYCRGEEEVGHNERLIGCALKSWTGSRPLIMTKGGVTRPGGGWGHDARPKSLRISCDRSLHALQLEQIWLYQLHALDPSVPIEESIGALHDLRQEGKIENIGLCNVTVADIQRATSITRIESVQNAASVFHPRGLIDGVLAYCERKGIAFIAHSPLGGSKARYICHEPHLKKLASELGHTPYQIALMWLLDKSPSLIPIPGASHSANARSSAAVACLGLPRVTTEVLDWAFLSDRSCA